MNAASLGGLYPLRVQLATSLWQRLRGLLGRPPLADGHAVWLSPCNAVHTFGMRYPIDILFLDTDFQVLKQVSALKPGKISRCKGASSVLELRAGTLPANGA